MNHSGLEMNVAPESAADNIPDSNLAPEVIKSSFQWFSRGISVADLQQLKRLRLRSFGLGVAGLMVLSISAIAASLFLALHSDDWTINDLYIGWIAVWVCVIYTMLATVFALATFIPLLGTQRLVFRCAASAASTLSLIVFWGCIAVCIDELYVDWEDLPEICAVVAAFSLGASLVAGGMQNLSSLSLVPCPTVNDRIRRLSILDLLELIAVVACVLTFWQVIGQATDMLMLMLILVAIGFGCGCILVPLFLGCFAMNRRGMWIGIAFFISFIVTSFSAGWIIFQEQGDLATPADISFMLFAGIVAASIHCLMTLAAFRWLQGCGWSMIAASTNRTSGSPVISD